MARLDNFKRIVKEDFDEAEQALAGKIGAAVNPFAEQVYNAFNKGINTDNLSRQIATIEVETSAAGSLKIQTQLKITLNSKVLGLNVINVENLTNVGVYPTSIPFLSWSIDSNLLTVKQVLGIQPNYKYRLTLEIIA